eukprot:11163144-Karenia_brevis.AAC.1
MEEIEDERTVAPALATRRDQDLIDERFLNKMRIMMKEVVREEVGKDIRDVKEQMEGMQKSMTEVRN